MTDTVQAQLAVFTHSDRILSMSPGEWLIVCEPFQVSTLQHKVDLPVGQLLRVEIAKDGLLTVASAIDGRLEKFHVYSRDFASIEPQPRPKQVSQRKHRVKR